MTDEKTVTEREAVMRERKAADLAVETVFRLARKCGGIEHVDGRRIAIDLYPIPKIKRPRVVMDSEGDYWRWNDGRLELRLDGSSEWIKPEAGDIVEVSRTAVRDVLSNPTEEVEA